MLPRCYLTRTASSRALPTLVPSSDDRAYHRWNLPKGIWEELTRKRGSRLPQAANTICNRDTVTVLDYLPTSILVGGRCVFYYYIQCATPTVISSSSIESNSATNGERERERERQPQTSLSTWLAQDPDFTWKLERRQLEAQKLHHRTSSSGMSAQCMEKSRLARRTHHLCGCTSTTPEKSF